MLRAKWSILSITPPKLMEPQGGGAESLSWRMGRSDEKCCFWGAHGFCTLELWLPAQDQVNKTSQHPGGQHLYHSMVGRVWGVWERVCGLLEEVGVIWEDL